MSDKLINEELQMLEELIRTASQHLTAGDSYSYLQNKDLRMIQNIGVHSKINGKKFLRNYMRLERSPIYPP